MLAEYQEGRRLAEETAQKLKAECGTGSCGTCKDRGYVMYEGVYARPCPNCRRPEDQP